MKIRMILLLLLWQPVLSAAAESLPDRRVPGGVAAVDSGLPTTEPRPQAWFRGRRILVLEAGEPPTWHALAGLPLAFQGREIPKAGEVLVEIAVGVRLGWIEGLVSGDVHEAEAELAPDR